MCSGDSVARPPISVSSPKKMVPMYANVLADLSRRGVEFIVVGGLAVGRAGFARFTEDIDLLVEASTRNLDRLIDGLAALGDGAARELTPADFPLEEGCVRIVEDVRIDVFTMMTEQTYDDLLPLSEEQPVHDQTVRFLGADGLIRLKETSVREKDQFDVMVLRRVLRERGE